jgi:hypothetical protein
VGGPIKDGVNDALGRGNVIGVPVIESGCALEILLTLPAD